MDTHSMISDEDAKRLFRNGQNLLAKHIDVQAILSGIKPNDIAKFQFYRGRSANNWVNQHPGACRRHDSVFNEFKVIPKYCFDCYKVFFAPRNVMELFKLMMAFEKLRLPNDNTRKCVITKSGTYKALIYCRSVEEGEEVTKITQKMISGKIQTEIPVTLQRGCTKFASAYPEYAQIGKGAKPMEYKEEWQVYEDIVDKTFIVDKQHPDNETNNRPEYTLNEAIIMLAWLKYAATKVDLSYLRISGCNIEPFRLTGDE